MTLTLSSLFINFMFQSHPTKMSEETRERRPLVNDDLSPTPPPPEDPHINVTSKQGTWHTVQKWDGLWHRVLLYDVGPPGLIFKWLNPRNPEKSRRRLGHLYWKALKRTIMSFNLLFFGFVFSLIAFVCHFECDDYDRAWV